MRFKRPKFQSAWFCQNANCGDERASSYIVEFTGVGGEIILLEETLDGSVLDLFVLCEMPVCEGRWCESEHGRDGGELHDGLSSSIVNDEET